MNTAAVSRVIAWGVVGLAVEVGNGPVYGTFLLHVRAGGARKWATTSSRRLEEVMVMQGGIIECPLCKGLKQIGCPTCGGAGLVENSSEPRSRRHCMNCGGLGLCTCTTCFGEGVMPIVPF